MTLKFCRLVLDRPSPPLRAHELGTRDEAATLGDSLGASSTAADPPGGPMPLSFTAL